MARIQDIIVLSIASFLGNVGVSLTGFGMAIIYLFVYQIVVLAGYDGNFRYAVFIQALALFSAQPLLLKKAEFKKCASWNVLHYFIPVTIVSTPLGQITGDIISTDMIEIVAGFLVTFVATFEMYQKRKLFVKHFRKRCYNGNKIDDSEPHHDEENPAPLSKTQNFNTGLIDCSHKCGDNELLNRNDHVEIAQKILDDSEEESEEINTKNSVFMSTYIIGKTLGKGSFSIVKEGTMRKSKSRSFAIKIIEKSSLFDGEEAYLVREIALLEEIRHENILYLHEVYDEPQVYYLVSDLMQGGDLLTRLNSFGFFQESEACRVAKCVLDAVRHIHDRKIAHRDLKPENILFTSNEDNAQVKLGDFGFASKEETPDSFSTMCGTPSYVAPEILKSEPYGCKVDMWSFGIIVWVMLVGYQPFRGDTDQELQHDIKKGEFSFDKEFWNEISDGPKEFISSLLVLDPTMRTSAKDAQSHRWISNKEKQSDRRTHDTKVFFMVGSQRSGSNWLRTMLNEREDLAGPHPPHIMRDVLPIIDKFGDLSIDENFRVLVDHICTFVEKNQVPWTDKHSSNVKFLRPVVYATALKSFMRVRRESLLPGSNGVALCKKMHLLSIFDAIMTYYCKVNGKRIWICKSMGMSEHHDLLLKFYGPKRLRYIYLVRDPRDVAMSFMKTPVGDCHWHAIITKWTRLQQYAMSIVKDSPQLIYEVHYESVLQNKESEVKKLYDFIGERRFGGVKRQSSVLCMDKTESVINRAKNGSEALKARRLSYQFKNLTRGPSFLTSQNKKWLHPETGLKTEEIQIIETVAHETMKRLGYLTHLVDVTTEPTVWNDHDLDHFKQLNQEGVLKMKEDLARDNPDDMARRTHQADALQMPPVYKPADWEGRSAADTTFNKKMWMSIKNYLNDSEAEIQRSSLDDILKETMSASIRKTLSLDDLTARRHIGKETSRVVKNRVNVRWASGTQSGYYADDHDKPNQDMHACQIGMTEKGSVDWFGVYDGNGSNGHECSDFARKEIPEEFEKRIASGESLLTAIEQAYMEVHKRLLATSDIETDISGTTATTLLLLDDKCFVANVGDSPAILGWQEDAQLEVSARFLCTEHTPRCAVERNRIKRAGGVVMCADQRDGLAPIHENWREDEIPRVWSTNNAKFPGCAFSRSIGNGIAHTLGVTARPEVSEHRISRKDRVLIIASDGVTEFMDAQTCVKIACSYKNPAESVNALIHEASERWMTRGDYMDDITAIVLFFDGDEDTCSIPHCSKSWKQEDDEHQKVLTPSIKQHNDNEEIVSVEDEARQEDDETLTPIGIAARFWTLLAGSTSGLLGGLCGIRGPPVILYFLHPPRNVRFDKNTQRATGAIITATNVAMRVVYYLIETFALKKEYYFRGSDWLLYVCVIVSSQGGVLTGGKLFDIMKDSRNNIRMILSIFLLLCGVSLLLSSLHF